MIKAVFILFLFLSITGTVSFSQEKSPFLVRDIQQNQLENTDNQQINQDEGYGSDDQEYNNAEEPGAEEQPAEEESATSG